MTRPLLCGASGGENSRWPRCMPSPESWRGCIHRIVSCARKSASNYRCCTTWGLSNSSARVPTASCRGTPWRAPDNGHGGACPPDIGHTVVCPYGNGRGPDNGHTMVCPYNNGRAPTAVPLRLVSPRGKLVGFVPHQHTAVGVVTVAGPAQDIGGDVFPDSPELDLVADDVFVIVALPDL